MGDQSFISLAITSGDFDMVKFLHDNRTEGCTQEAMFRAVRNGHLEIVKYLYENYLNLSVTDALVKTMILEILHKKILKVIRWYYVELGKEIDKGVIEWVIGNGDMELVRDLYAKMKV